MRPILTVVLFGLWARPVAKKRLFLQNPSLTLPNAKWLQFGQATGTVMGGMLEHQQVSILLFVCKPRVIGLVVPVTPISISR